LVHLEASTCHIPRTNIITNTSLIHTMHIDTFDGSKQKQYEVPFSIFATIQGTVHYLTFYVDCSFTNKADPGANFVLGINPGGANPWTEVSVLLNEAIPVQPKDKIDGVVKVLPSEKRTEVIVTAVCEGAVVTTKTGGRYVYTF